ncbi:MAG: hypothetical protein IH940_05790 [Acidobacteria bacterium]|nr:hypothetical protein [Acidobacteriota bacterium]
MKARIVLMLSVVLLALAAFAPAASAESGYGPSGCLEGSSAPASENVVECETTDVVDGGVEDPVEQAPEAEKLAFTGASSQLMLMIAVGLIGGGALVVTGTRRLGGS